MKKTNRGFTLIEVLIVIGILAILAGVVLVAINPARQFAQARDTQRMSNVASILNAIGQNIAENKGIFECGEDFEFPENPIEIKSGSGGLDIYNCVVPDYLAEIPVDPKEGSLEGNEYSTGYEIEKTDGERITITAPHAELEEISMTR